MKSDSRSATLRSFAILDAVARSEHGLTLTEIVEATALSKPSAHRILAVLVAGGLLRRAAENRLFEPGPALRHLALAVMGSGAASGASRAVLKGLAQELGETCALGVLDGPEVVYVERAESMWPLRFDLPIGSRLPLHSTASGKLLLAHLPAAQRTRMLGALTLARSAARTITEPRRLAAALEVIRVDGYATDDEEFLPGLICLAVPVAAKGSRSITALTVQIPVARGNLDTARGHLPELHRAAAALASEFATAP